MIKVEETTQGVLDKISEGFEQKGAYNLRQNGISVCHGDSEHIKIRKKEDKPGIDIFIDRLQDKAESNEYLNRLQQNDKYEEVKEALNVGDYNMIVTPKEIDDLIENMKDIVARGINFAV